MTVIDFPNASHRRGASRHRAAYRSRTGACNGPNMQRLLFRSSHLIVESDEADLVRDVCFGIDRAQTSMQLLTAAETKLTAAIVAALLSTRGGLSNG